jgi:hypothetical protein
LLKSTNVEKLGHGANSQDAEYYDHHDQFN